MTIVNISPAAPFNDGWSYQENLLPKYQAKLGHSVFLIVPNLCHSEGKIIETKEEKYMSEDGFTVIRMSYKKHFFKKLDSILLTLKGLYEVLSEIRPDFVFFHGLVSDSIFDVIKYKNKKNKNLVIVQDNHLDFNIGIKLKRISNYCQRFIYRWIFKRSLKHISRVYGVTPWRKEYAEIFFKVPPILTDILIMGADDEKIKFQDRAIIRNSIRDKYQIKEKEFVVLSGGKIDCNKKIDVLIDGINQLPNVKLIIFGSVDHNIEKIFYDKVRNSSNCIYIGWIKSDLFYDYCFASDLVVFPGQHSVLWEQACATKTPCAFARWPGMQHVDNGGNAVFFSDITSDGIRQMIKKLIWTDSYVNMKKVASSDKTDIFLYSKIAKKSLECANE